MRPMTQVCCGCSLHLGVQTIILSHLAWCLMWIWMVTCNIILRIPALAVGVNRPQQTVNAIWNLAGLPFIIMALWGLWHRVDVQVRLYLHYLVVSFSMHLVLIIYYLFVQDACSLLPSTLKYNGLAFACGVVRGCSIAVLLSTLLVQYYIAYIVWSWCEDVRAGISGKGLGALYGRRQQHYGSVGSPVLHDAESLPVDHGRHTAAY
mmetsp:Transcript_23433/g.51554  ORF Transcript_23433/g.51554 Transcript_23433/m.51554 type:complete len:206 (+) Transcript_23433:80-697(+)